jgi:hypothetical protein
MLILPQIAGLDGKKYGNSLEDIEFVTREISYYAIFEAMYLTRRAEATEELSNALLRVYTKILEYLSKAKHYYSHNTASISSLK